MMLFQVASFVIQRENGFLILPKVVQQHNLTFKVRWYQMILVGHFFTFFNSERILKIDLHVIKLEAK